MTSQTAPAAGQQPAYALETRCLQVFYGDFHAIKDVDLRIPARKITALIGPSGCGKSTVLRTFNRMNDLIPGTRIEGEVLYGGRNLYDRQIDAVKVRRRIGIVFQEPNPFPDSIYDNVAYGPRVVGWRLSSSELDDLVEQSLRSAAIWDEVKDKLNAKAQSLSGGQQQRLCIARTLALQPDTILMDEPTSALDPVATGKIEELLFELRRRYTIVIVTHHMQQAARTADETAFFLMDDAGAGTLIEHAATEQLFQHPHDERTEQYISGRFG